MPVAIVTDSTCDLPPDLAGEFGVTVVPLTISFGEETYRDGVDITAAEFYERLATSKVMPRTSQPPANAFEAVYRRLAESADGIVSIHISSRLSGTLNSASVAREAVGHDVHVELIDSYNVGLGLGEIVLAAARVAREGGSFEDVVRAARGAIPRVHVVVALDTLEYLRRGGRIGRASAWAGSMLNIKPIVHVEGGEVAPLERVRTKRRAFERLVELATQDRNPERLYVASAGNDVDALALRDRVAPLLPHTELVMGRIGPAVGVYTGPGTFGFCSVRRARP
ncbi:MAG: DegV family protein [Dehalococcoidia bacterium]